LVKTRDGEISCSNCGYRWFPNANRWRNTNLSHNHKVVICPACNKKIPLTRIKLRQVIKRSAFVKRVRELGKA
jgi:DNA-directed RNA polymerase subunit RPC12/RpoP